MVLIVIMLAGVAWRVLGSSRRAAVPTLQSEAAVPVEVVPVKTQTLTETISAGGTVEALREVTTTTKLTGHVAAVLVREGDRVQAGQVLVRLEDREIAAQVQQAEANLQAAQARVRLLEQGARPEERAQVEAALAQARANFDTARESLARMETLYKDGAVSKAQLDAAQLQYDVAKAQYDSAVQQQRIVQTGARPEEIEMARAQVRQADAALAFARLQADNAVIRAPLSGTVTHRYVDPGDLASQMPGQSNLITVAQIDSVYAVLELSETDLGRVRVGQTAVISIDAYPDRSFTGLVREVSPAANPVTRSFKIKVVVDNRDRTLKPGMFARGEIVVAQVSDALVIPRDAVVSANGKSTVFVVDADKARVREVQLGQISGPVVQVRVGLRAGESVVVAGQDQLTDGTAVSVR